MLAVHVIVGFALTALLVRPGFVSQLRRRRSMVREPVPTFVFADLVGFTSLSERCGDEAAARLAAEFRRSLSSLCRQHGAWQVKSMGDGAMVWAPDPGCAVELAVRAVHELGGRPDLLPVRVGAHTGPAIRRGGDWYGAAVNVAARLVKEAEPNEALISRSTRMGVRGKERWPLKYGGELTLRGVRHPIAVWRLPGQAPRALGCNECPSPSSSSPTRIWGRHGARIPRAPWRRRSAPLSASSRQLPMR